MSTSPSPEERMSTRPTRGSRRALILVAAALLLQAALLAAVLRPQLSARVAGAEYRLAAGPVDPVDPFRGAYVMLTYPGLPSAEGQAAGQVYVPLVRDGALWKGAGVERLRPATQPYLACRTSGYGDLKCGVDSLFLPEDKARSVESELRGDRAAAVLKIDGAGNAALVDVVAR
ncbi:GDYXXLXY domain-containing protein [Sphaerisporangium dianthi]|uniref:GDYXXLXY domain-containing protein n=1 Tax=Sphaerisporangium dianthi TaxID=1436120 RepID=A0ABV9CRX6_9ACTN